ncbi:hypothetical protein HY256_04165, partial [Candidatus Sumerlaeota bacterium]|nr:hypothetical protein [Candidatus Sumerlaeota bacterium]
NLPRKMNATITGCLENCTHPESQDIGLVPALKNLDGAEKKVFEATRVGAHYETVVENFTALAELKRQRGAKLPELNVNMTVMRKNIHQVPMLVRLAHKMGAQSVSFSSVVIYKEADIGNSVAEEPEFEKYMEEGRQIARHLGLSMTFWRQKPLWWEPDFHNPHASYGCSQLWSTQIIEPDGSMKFCCYIERDIGNVFELGPDQAYNCDELRRQRRLLMEGNVRPECQGCLYLRERSPSWIQGMINEATKLTQLDPQLTGEDRRELMEIIAQVQAKKDAMYPLHAYLHPEVATGAEGKSAFAVWEAAKEAELPIY